MKTKFQVVFVRGNMRPDGVSLIDDANRLSFAQTGRVNTLFHLMDQESLDAFFEGRTVERLEKLSFSPRKVTPAHERVRAALYIGRIILDSLGERNMNQATYVDGFHDRDAVAKMKYSPLGNTGLVVSRLAFGGGPLGGLYGLQQECEAVSTVHRALRAGVNYIDTAPWYGNGRSEEVLGKALATVPRKSYYIATKVGRYEPAIDRMFDFSAERVFKSIDRSLELLGLDYVDIIQVHDVEFAENLEIVWKETLPALAEVVKRGKARFIGVTGYPLSDLKEVILNSPVKVDLILTYARNTLIDQTLLEYLPFFKERGIAVLNACSVAMGMLSESPVQSWHPATKEIKDACRKAVEYCKAAGGDLARVAIYYSLETPGIAAHLTGSRTLEILDRNLETYTSEPTELDKRLAREVKQKFFDGLSQKHWEGIEKLGYQQELKKLRGKISKD